MTEEVKHVEVMRYQSYCSKDVNTRPRSPACTDDRFSTEVVSGQSGWKCYAAKSAATNVYLGIDKDAAVDTVRAQCGSSGIYRAGGR